MIESKRRCRAIYKTLCEGAQSLALLLLACGLAHAGWFPAHAAAQTAQVRSQAVILIYHRFGEDDIPSTNVRLEQFEMHLAELAGGGYSVLPLAEIVAAFREGRPLPDKAVAITVDDAYRSFALEAWPRLKRLGFPATLFVATDPVDGEIDRYLSWDEIRALAADGVAIGHHGAAHLHMVDAGLAAARRDIARASRRFREELGEVPDLFAYPYGEYSLALSQLIEETGFDGAVAQYSGVAASDGDIHALPRFPFSERYADMSRFRLIAGARALPVTDILPRDPVLGEDDNPPAYGFTLTEPVPGLSALACYPNHTGQAEVSFLGEDRVEVRVDRPFPPGRGRINCTLPGPDRRWYWLGKFLYVPGAPPD